MREIMMCFLFLEECLCLCFLVSQKSDENLWRRINKSHWFNHFNWKTSFQSKVIGRTEKMKDGNEWTKRQTILLFFVKNKSSLKCSSVINLVIIFLQKVHCDERQILFEIQKKQFRAQNLFRWNCSSVSFSILFLIVTACQCKILFFSFYFLLY